MKRFVSLILSVCFLFSINKKPVDLPDICDFFDRWAIDFALH